MHYRNGREAKNGDEAVLLEGGKVKFVGKLENAVPGNDYCNGELVLWSSVGVRHYACLCDMLHVDDVAAMLAERNLDKRPPGK